MLQTPFGFKESIQERNSTEERRKAGMKGFEEGRNRKEGHAHTHMYIYMCVCIYIYTFICTYTHAHVNRCVQTEEAGERD